MFEQTVYNIKKAARFNSLNVSGKFNPFLHETFRLRQADYLHNLYVRSQNKEAPVKLMLSLVNSMLHHRLTFFMLDSYLSFTLFQNDRNYNNNESLEVNEIHFKRAVDILINMGIIRKAKVLGKNIIYEIIDKDLLNEIKPTELEKTTSFQNAIDFINKK